MAIHRKPPGKCPGILPTNRDEASAWIADLPLAAAMILNAIQQDGSSDTSVVAESGQPFDRATWAADVGASTAAPIVNTDVFMPAPIGVTMDVCQGIRLNDG